MAWSSDRGRAALSILFDSVGRWYREVPEGNFVRSHSDSSRKNRGWCLQLPKFRLRDWKASIFFEMHLTSSVHIGAPRGICIATKGRLW